VTVVTGKRFKFWDDVLKLLRYSIPGGARGIGLALAHGAAELGSDVAVLDILDQPNEAFDDLEKDLGVRAKYYRLVRHGSPAIEQLADLKWFSRTSVTDTESLSKTFEAVSTDFGRIDNWYAHGHYYPRLHADKPFPSVTAAGIVCDRPFLETHRDEGMRVLEVNVC
jgi:NAD(P)-dependent dehydrogenase (short-subunit alcohol dehydrogenase family)